ncbi:MAG: hypothetical protein V5A59_06870 [Bacteroidales bacterium]
MDHSSKKETIKRSEIRYQRSEVGRQRSEIGGQKTEVGGRRSEIGNDRAKVRKNDGTRERKCEGAIGRGSG